MPDDLKCLVGADDYAGINSNSEGKMIHQNTRYRAVHSELKVGPEQVAIIKMYAKRVGKKTGRMVSEKMRLLGFGLTWISGCGSTTAAD
jgi:hypothetical protein